MSSGIIHLIMDAQRKTRQTFFLQRRSKVMNAIGVIARHGHEWRRVLRGVADSGKFMRTLSALLLWLWCGAVAAAQALATADLSSCFAGRDGCFVAYDPVADRYVRYNPKGCAERFSPCS